MKQHGSRYLGHRPPPISLNRISREQAPFEYFGVYADITDGHATIEKAQIIASKLGLKPINVSRAVILGYAEVEMITRQGDRSFIRERAADLVRRMARNIAELSETPTTDLAPGKVHRFNTFLGAQLFNPKQYTQTGAIALRSLLQYNLTDLHPGLAIAYHKSDYANIQQPLLPIAKGLISSSQLEELGKDIRELRTGEFEPIALGPPYIEPVRRREPKPEEFSQVVM